MNPVLRCLSCIVLPAVLLLLLPSCRRAPPEKTPLTVAEILSGVPAEGYARALAPRKFDFPADHGPHPGFRNEWWYFTGNLSADDGRRFGYQLTFFRTSLSPNPRPRQSRWGASEVYMAHFALTDVSGKRFHAAERFSREALGLAGAGGVPLRVWVEDWEARVTGEKPWGMRLSAGMDGTSIDLRVRSVVPPVLNGEGGLSRKSSLEGNASYYYSIPRMETAGTIRAGGRAYRVSGLSWFDREWSTSALEKNQVGWDWFALHLEDGRSVMLYRLRKRDGSIDPVSSGTLTLADGSARSLSADEVNLDILGSWRSSATDVRYPARWRLRIPGEGLDLEILPLLPDQELRMTFRYWEGAVAVKGRGASPGGYGYVELTGYGGPVRPEGG